MLLPIQCCLTTVILLRCSFLLMDEEIDCSGDPQISVMVNSEFTRRLYKMPSSPPPPLPHVHSYTHTQTWPNGWFWPKKYILSARNGQKQAYWVKFVFRAAKLVRIAVSISRKPLLSLTSLVRVFCLLGQIIRLVTGSARVPDLLIKSERLQECHIFSWWDYLLLKKFLQRCILRYCVFCVYLYLPLC